jgi:YesN/AraC family two-component response regulator
MARILIIDDDNQFRVMLRIMLENAGYKDIEEAENGYIGMKLIRKNPFDLVITDIVMPDKEGIETIMELRRDFPAIKIIAMSGGGEIGPETYLEMAGHLGAGRTLEKPFQQPELVDAVRGLLGE